MELPKRKKLRLEQYDYSKNCAYFITICTEDKKKILCDLRLNEMDGTVETILSPLGRIVEETIQKIPGLDQYVIMPNHVHLILFNEKEQPISKLIQFFKINVARKTGKSIWQRSFYDHIIRDEEDYLTKWNYIVENPSKWADDDYYR